MSYADEMSAADQAELDRLDRKEDPKRLEAELEYENSHNADDDESADLDRLAERSDQ